MRDRIIRDSLYSRIALSPLAQQLTATPQFLRLQRVKQLGWVFLVWPGATHTRYEHSLGVYHLMREAITHLIALGDDGGLHDADPAELRALEAAALLHDIGHYPYSHCIEELGGRVQPHEVTGTEIIEGDTVSRVLQDWAVDPRDVARLIRGEVKPGSQHWHVYLGLLSGALDVDKLDYLPRDARACNVPYGGVDSERLLDSLRVLPPGYLGITEKGISPLHSLTVARQEMFDNVYWHHTNRACMVMLLRAVQDTLDAKALDARLLATEDDAGLLATLSTSCMPRSTRTLVESLIARKIHKRAVEYAFQAGEVYARLNNLFYSPAARKALEIALAEKVSAEAGMVVAPWEILIDIPKPEKWEVDVRVCFERPPYGMPARTTWTEAVGISGDTLAAYERHQRRIRIVTTERLRDRVWNLRYKLTRFILDLTAPT